MDICPIWNTPATFLPRTGDRISVRSERTAGSYSITGSAAGAIAAYDDQQRARLTTWLIDQRSAGTPMPLVDTTLVEIVRTARSMPVNRRADRLLQLVTTQTRFLGEPVRIFMHSMWEHLAWSESTNADEVRFLVDLLESRGWASINRQMGAYDAKVLAEGYDRVDEVTRRESMSSQAFIAMWFNSSLDAARDDGLVAAIRDAGYKPMRIDMKAHNNKIDDEIIAEIRRSRFVVADFTHGQSGARGGVYYEAGFAHGLGLPVIFTIRKDLIDQAHFDTRQYSHILWEDPEDLRKQLADRIAATLGDGPHRAAG